MHTHGGLVDELLECVQLDVCEDLVVLVQAGEVADGHEEVVGVVEHGVEGGQGLRALSHFPHQELQVLYQLLQRLQFVHVWLYEVTQTLIFIWQIKAYSLFIGYCIKMN